MWPKGDDYQAADGITDGTWKFTVSKAKVDVPAAKTGFVYNGKEQTGEEAAADAKYVLSGNTGTQAGSYTAVVALSDKANYEWGLATPTSDDQPIAWSIGFSAESSDFAVDQEALDKIKQGCEDDNPGKTVNVQMRVSKGGASAGDVALIQAKVGSKKVDAVDASLIVTVGEVRVASSTVCSGCWAKAMDVGRIVNGAKQAASIRGNNIAVIGGGAVREMRGMVVPSHGSAKQMCAASRALRITECAFLQPVPKRWILSRNDMKPFPQGIGNVCLPGLPVWYESCSLPTSRYVTTTPTRTTKTNSNRELETTSHLLFTNTWLSFKPSTSFPFTATRVKMPLTSRFAMYSISFT